MANKTYAIHTSESNISRLDEWAEKLRRSRNSILNEAVEMVLEHYDSANLHRTDARNAATKLPNTRKKAGAR